MMAGTHRERQQEMLLLARLQLIRELQGDLRQGRPPWPRMMQAQRSLEEDEDLVQRGEELRFVEGLLSILLAHTVDQTMERLDRLASAQARLGRLCGDAGHVKKL
jgi:hypothetical protein